MVPQFDSASRDMQILNFDIPQIIPTFKKITPFAENKFGKQRMTLLVTDEAQKGLDKLHKEILNMDVTVYTGLESKVVKFGDLCTEDPKPMHRNGFIDVGPATGRTKMFIEQRNQGSKESTFDEVQDSLNRLTPHNVVLNYAVWARHDGEKHVFGYFAQLAKLIY